jgi:hypothetical protein
MALKKPTTEDQRKLHAEINQINHQQFLLTTTALTLFGLIIAWVVPKQPTNVVIGPFEFSAATLLSLLIFALFMHGQFLRGKLRTYTTYLVVTGGSHWEEDFGKYLRAGGNRQWWGYSELYAYMTNVFLSMLFPFLLCLMYRGKIESQGIWLIDVIVGIAVLPIIYFMGRRGWGRPDDKISRTWEQLNRSPGQT